MSSEVFELDREACTFGGNKAPWWDCNDADVRDGALTVDDFRAKLGWDVGMEPVYGADGLALPADVGRLVVRTDLERSDVRRYLACVGRDYTPIQHSVLVELGSAILDVAASDAKLETFGTLKNGRYVWALFNLTTESVKIRDDVHHTFLLAYTSHDGSTRLTLLPTSVRVVCWNTLTWADTSASARYRISHRSGAKVAIDDARRALKLAHETQVQATERIGKLADVDVSDRFKLAFAQAMFPVDTSKQVPTRAINKQTRLIELANGAQQGGNLASVKNTAYGLVSAYAELIDHESNPRTSGRTDRELGELRFQRSLLRQGAAGKREALELVERYTLGDGRQELIAVERGATERMQAVADKNTSNESIDKLLSMINLS